MAKIKARQNVTQTIGEVFPEFINSCKVKNLAKDSIQNYQDKYKKLVGFLSDSQPCSNINRKTIDGFILALQDQELSDASINTIIRSCRVFLYWCMANEYTPKFNINLIKEDTPAKTVYTDAELKILIKKPKTTDFAEYRNWVIVNYLIGTGNRLSTIVYLNKGDVDFENKTVILRHTKNRKPQIIPIGNTLCKVLRDYVKLFLFGIPDDTFLFPNRVIYEIVP